MTTSVRDSLREVIDYDDARPSAPFEHGLAALAAGGLIASAFLSRSRCGAVLQAVVGGVLLMRAASGQDGVRRWTHAEPAPLSKVIIAK